MEELDMLQEAIEKHCKKHKCYGKQITWADLSLIIARVLKNAEEDGPDEGDGPDWK